MFDGLFWKPIKTRPAFQNDGTLEWLVLERHRITGEFRTADPAFAQIRAQDFTFSKGGKDD